MTSSVLGFLRGTKFLLLDHSSSAFSDLLRGCPNPGLVVRHPKRSMIRDPVAAKRVRCRPGREIEDATRRFALSP